MWINEIETINTCDFCSESYASCSVSCVSGNPQHHLYFPSTFDLNNYRLKDTRLKNPSTKTVNLLPESLPALPCP